VRARRDHTFAGIDPPWGASAADAERAAERARALLDAALDLRARVEGRSIALELENTARGHDVPTGIASMREIGVDVEWIDASGARTVVRALDVGDRPTRAGVEVPLPTDADHVEARSLHAGEVRMAVLSAPRGAVAADVVLRARAFRADALEALGIDGGEVPTLELSRGHYPSLAPE
jgi:hypothetical protein